MIPGFLKRIGDTSAETPDLTGLRQLPSFPPAPLVSSPFVGRVQEQAYTLRLLRQRGVVAITGPSGSGKTALATAVAQAIALPVYWIALYPGLNDRIEPFLWQLARPLARLAPVAWRMLHQMQQSSWNYPPIVRLQMILEAYTHIKEEIVLCLDTQQCIIDPTMESLIVGFCDYIALTHHTQMKLIVVGSALPYKVGSYTIPALNGLSADVIQIWAHQLDLDVSDAAAELIYRQTSGLPQAVVLFFEALANNSEQPSFERIAILPQIRHFVQHLLSPLTSTERAVVAQLVSHPEKKSPFSLDTLPVLEFLETRHLAQVSSHDITVHPLIRSFYQNHA